MTALGPGVAASVLVMVRDRRNNWYVEGARAPLASIQLDTQLVDAVRRGTERPAEMERRRTSCR